MQAFSLNATTGGQITGRKGTRVIIKPMSFEDINGNPVNGNIKLNLIEVLTPADMILNNTATMSNGLPIESGGAFYVNATYNNGKDTATLAPGKFVQITLAAPSASLPGMQVFKGYTADTSRSMIWYNYSGQGNIVQKDTSSVYSMFCDDIEWINCDRFMSEPKISFTFEPGNDPSADSTIVFVHFTGRNAVMELYSDRGHHFISQSLIAAPVTIIGICMVNQMMYTAISTATLTDKGSYTMQFTPSTPEALKAKLQSLK